MRIQILISMLCIPLSVAPEEYLTHCASALLELRSALSPCSSLRSNPTIRAYPNIPNLWIVPHSLPSEHWEHQALIAIGASRLYTENHDTAALLEALSDSEKIALWNETIAGELGLSSKRPVDLDAEKLEVALEGLPFNAQWLSDLSENPSPEQTVFLITQDADWAVVARVAPDCSIILHSEKTGEAPASLIPRIQKVLTP